MFHKVNRDMNDIYSEITFACYLITRGKQLIILTYLQSMGTLVYVSEPSSIN